MTARAAVFLDRDGVLNHAIMRDGRPYPPSTPGEVVILPGVLEAIDALHQANLMTVVITNQPDIARGTARIEDVVAINEVVAAATGVDLVLMCAHDDADECDCRKPLPGMIMTAAAEHDIDLDRSVMVGDRWRDIAAGQAAGLTTIHVDRGYDERRPQAPDHVVAELAEAVPWILKTIAQGA